MLHRVASVQSERRSFARVHKGPQAGETNEWQHATEVDSQYENSLCPAQKFGLRGLLRSRAAAGHVVAPDASPNAHRCPESLGCELINANGQMSAVGGQTQACGSGAI